MKKLTAILGFITILFGIGFPSNKLEVQAKRCYGLEVVEGNGSNVVTKEVSVRNLGFLGDNWHTDFAVPGNRNFRSYIAKIESRSRKTESTTVEVFLKYSNGTADQQFKGNITLPAGKYEQITVTPRRNQQPYQINVQVGDDDSAGFNYSLSVVGCDR